MKYVLKQVFYSWNVAADAFCSCENGVLVLARRRPKATDHVPLDLDRLAVLGRFGLDRAHELEVWRARASQRRRAEGEDSNASDVASSDAELSDCDLL